MLKIPYGVSNFEKLRKDNYTYIDKTEYIERLESYGEPYIFYLRPRRFGKTLFISTLEHYYDCKKKDEFAKIIKDEVDYEIETVEIKKSIVKLALEGEITDFVTVVEELYIGYLIETI